METAVNIWGYCLWLVGSLVIAWQIGIFSSKVWAAAVLWFLLAGIPLFGRFAIWARKAAC